MIRAFVFDGGPMVVAALSQVFGRPLSVFRWRAEPRAERANRL